ncbi:MAG: hypothetical protein ACFFCW_33525 [Candidatus Hodarchaeota archaeon]
MNESLKPTRFVRVRESRIIVWLKKWWFRIFQKYKEIWWAMTFAILVLSTWQILPYLPFLMPDTFPVPVQATSLKGPDGIRVEVVHPNRVAPGQKFPLRIKYRQTLRQSEGVESVYVIIRSERPEVQIKPKPVFQFPAGEKLQAPISKEGELNILTTEKPPQQLTLTFKVQAGQTPYQTILEVPMVGWPLYIVQLIAFLCASGLLAGNSLLPLLIKVGSYILGRMQAGGHP